MLAYRLLSHLWEAQEEGNAVSLGRFLKTEPVYSEADLESLLLQLHKAHLVLRTERDEWALARDMGKVSLLDLYRAGAFVLPAGAGQDKVAELAPVLDQLEADLRRTLDLPLSSLFEKKRGSDNPPESI